ncbi:MAG: fasciclin domain-containing protein [Bacteroidetes bacterium]|nr:fasciclin domain-containing protein [Bacteroidota bacterium]
MKKKIFVLAFAYASACIALTSCNSNKTTDESTAATEPTAATEAAASGGQSTVKDDVSKPNVVGVAASSKDHTTLVAAVKAAELVDALSNNGPFTVFAPTNAAFDKLPKGTLDELLKPENKSKLQDILYDHVWVGVMKEEMMQDGKKVTMFGGNVITLHKKDGKWMADDANILASIPAANGIIHVVDGVLLRAPKK